MRNLRSVRLCFEGCRYQSTARVVDLLNMRAKILLIFHHSIISRASHGCFGGFMPPVEKGCSISQPLGLGV
jgi:hypothetical protein